MSQFIAPTQETTVRAATSLRLLFVTAAAMLAAGCDDESDLTGPGESLGLESPAPDPEPASGPLEDFAYWADGYLQADPARGTSYQPLPDRSFNRSGGPITVTKVGGTTGRYIARFSGLSALVGKNTVHVSGAGDDPTYCKPVGAYLVRDSVEVRCFRMGSGKPADAAFYLQVIGKRDDRAFAFANRHTASNYAPASAGSWNPAGSSRIYRDGVGRYRVVFKGFGARLSPGVGGHVQLGAVGTAKAYCKVQEWDDPTDLIVSVGCFTPAGAPADAKFSALFTPPAAHLAYVWADYPTTSDYKPVAEYASNPVGGAIYVQRKNVGSYEIGWTGANAEIRDLGNPQVTAYGGDNAQCKVEGLDADYVEVQCFAANGVPMDANYTVLLGS